MPFKNKAQMKACFSKDSPKWDCQAWAHETKDLKGLPKGPKPKPKKKGK